jgi:chromosome segregation ATPase
MPSESRDDDLQDSDPTDELPVLLETAVLDPALVAEAIRPAEIAAYEEVTGQHDFAAHGARIETLEADLQRLSSRCLELEQLIGERDAAVARLEDALAAARQSLAERAQAEQQLVAAIAARDAKLADLDKALERERGDRAAQDAALAEQRHRTAQLESELAAARDAHDAARAALVTERSKPPPSADERLDSLKEEVATLSSYIDNRKTRWDELEAQLRAATARIGELERELAHRTERQRAADALAQNEHERAETLRRDLVDASRLLAGRERELAAVRSMATPLPDRAVEALQAELERATELNARLQAELENALEPDTTLKPAAAAARSNEAAFEIVAQLENELEHKRAQITALSSEAAQHARAAEAVRAELAETRAALDSARIETEKRRAEIGRIEQALIERERALDARQNYLGALQREIEQPPTTRGPATESRRDRDPLRAARIEAPETAALICLTSDIPRQYALTKPSMTIGRSSQCDIQVLTQFVSREHARLVVDRSHVLIEDLGSTNGVFVNSVRVDRQELRHGDLVTVGETQFRFLETMAH